MSTVSRRASAWTALAATILLTGCSWRVETPDPTPPTPDQYQTLRGEAAVAEAKVIDALAFAEPPGPGGQWLLAFETTAASIHLDALGGVYEPFPSSTPEVSPSPPADLGPTALSRFAAFARDCELAAALLSDDPDLTLLLASMGLSHAVALGVAAQRDAEAAGAVTILVMERTPPVPGGAFAALVPETSALATDTLTEIVVAHDYAAYAYEIIAARSAGDPRNDSLARSRLHAKRAEDLAALLAEDPRAPGYQIGHDDLASEATMAAFARDTEAGLADRYLAALYEVAGRGSAGDDDRAWLISGAYDALVQQLLWPGAELADASVLPGVVLAGA